MRVAQAAQKAGALIHSTGALQSNGDSNAVTNLPLINIRAKSSNTSLLTIPLYQQNFPVVIPLLQVMALTSGR